MLKRPHDKIRHCYRRAAQCRERAAQAKDAEAKSKFLAIEERWLRVARSYEFTESLSDFGAEARRHLEEKCPPRLAHINDNAFAPEDVTILVEAFEGALKALELKHREDPLTLCVARCIIDLGKQGERDPTRLRERTLEILGK